MLTDTKLRSLKAQDKLYKVNDRDGLYVAVTPAGTISFRYNYAINGRQETMTFGRYGVALAQRELDYLRQRVAARLVERLPSNRHGREVASGRPL